MPKMTGTVSQNKKYYTFYLWWSYTQSVSGNYSNVKVSSYWTHSGGVTFETSQNQPYYIEINGNRKSGAKPFDLNPWPSNPYLIQTYTVKVPHNSDGKKTINIKGGVTLPSLGGWSPGTSYASGNITLPTIPRASQPTISPVNGTVGDNIKIDFHRKSSSFTHDVTIKFGTRRTYTYSNKGASFLWGSGGVRDDLLASYPNNSSMAYTVSVRTKSGSTTVGTKTVNGSLMFDWHKVKPVVNSFKYRDTNSKTTYITGNNQILIQNSSIVDIRDVQYTLESHTSFARQEGSWAGGSIGVRVYDTRGFYGELYKYPTIIPYYPIIVNSYSLERVNSDGENINVNVSGNISALNINSVNKNHFVGARLYYKTGNSVESSLIIPPRYISVNLSNETFSINHTTAKVFDSGKSYELRLALEDDLNISTVTSTLSKAIPIINIESSGVEIHGDLSVSGKIVSSDGDYSPQWDNVSYQSGFSDYDTTVYNRVGYIKDGDIVEFRGLVQIPPGTFTNNWGKATMFTLPQKYRPQKTILLSSTISGMYAGTFKVNPDGTCVIWDFPEKNLSISRAWISLENVRFHIKTN